MKIILAEGITDIVTDNSLNIVNEEDTVVVDFGDKNIYEVLESIEGKQVKLILEVQNDK